MFYKILKEQEPEKTLHHVNSLQSRILTLLSMIYDTQNAIFNLFG
jgi:hypothetical protein